jgi:pyruvate dehydrogenase E2 component (dihydrolipoamide acetyltransferase)
MSRMKQFKLPDLGEGLTEGEILKWLVAPGDEVKLNQPIVEVETAKAAVEIPSPYAGVVADLHTAEGETVDVGTPIITFDTDPGAGPAPAAEPPAAEAPTGEAPAAEAPAADEDEEIEAGKIGGAAPGGRIAVLVGYGPKTVTAQRRPRKPAAPTEAPLEDPELSLLPSIPDSLHSAAKPVRHGGLEMGRALERAAEAASAPVRAKPPVRKLARDLGIDLASVRGSGPDGSITREDVQRAAQSATVAPEPAAVAQPHPVTAAAPVAAPVWDASREQRVPIKGVRKLTAEAMVQSAFTAPHVTEFLTVDVTRTMRAVQRLKESPEFAGARVSPLLLVAKAMVLAVGRHPMVNSSWDAESGEIVVKEYVNLGIAAATPRGLIVPNIKDAGRLSLRQLADALTALVTTAKEGKTPPADMQGGTITITNVGVFGVDTGTPILNRGESAILAFGAVREQPWVHKGKVKVRQVCQLALSFDHRIVDGELGSRFLADVGRFLNDPQEALLAWS